MKKLSCIICGKPFNTPNNSSKKHCSIACRFRPIADEFKNIEGCWEWQKSVNPQTGYGQIMDCHDGKCVLRTVHRLAYEIFNGKIPEGLFVLHHCDNRRCFNPEHLFIGTQQDNMNDMKTKGRERKNPNKGEKHHQAKLTESEVIAIRQSKETYSELAKKYSVSISHICSIRKRRSWRHI